MYAAYNLDDIALFDKEEKPAGVLKCHLTYDSVSWFRGEMAAGAKGKVRRRMELSKGRCPTKNLFSIIDPAAKDQKKKFMESIYMDDE